VHTNEHRSYRPLALLLGYAHAAAERLAAEYVHGHIQTDSTEPLWALPQSN